MARKPKPGRRQLDENAVLANPLAFRRGPRRRGRPRTLPGAKKKEWRLDPQFLAWKAHHPSGTVPEWFVYTWLERHGWKEGTGFAYVPVVGGPRRLQGVQIDFLVDAWLAINVDGVYWHHRLFDTEQAVKNEMDRATVEGLGLVFVSVLDTDVVERTEATMQLALRGLEQPGARDGVGHV